MWILNLKEGRLIRRLIVVIAIAPFTLLAVQQRPSSTAGQQRTSSITAQKRAATRLIETKRNQTDFDEHQFSTSYEIFQIGNQPRRIKFIQEIRNVSKVAAKEVRWISCGIKVRNLAGTTQPIVNDYQFDGDLRPELFDSWRDLGLSAIEIDRLTANGGVETSAKDTGPCYLPHGDDLWRRLREGYPPYRYLYDLLKNPFGVMQRYFDGKIEIKLSSNVIWAGDAFVYNYHVETDSLQPVYFQWPSVSGVNTKTNGLIGQASKDKPYNFTFKTAAGPGMVTDVFVANTESTASLPNERLERLPDSFRVHQRFSGGVTDQPGTFGVNHLPDDYAEPNFAFTSPAIVPKSR